MKLINFFFISLFFLSCKVSADNLINHLNNFFKKEYALDVNNFKIIVHTPFKKQQICKKPYFLLGNNFNHFGLFNILYICGQQYQHLKGELQITGKYIVAKKKILRGLKIKASDLKTVIGRLDSLPNETYLNKKDVIGRVNVRDILPFQPITSFMTRVFWIIKANQQVTIKIQGASFEVISFGRSLSNGGVHEKIRVQMNNGKIITGKINKNGEVIVIL